MTAGLLVFDVPFHPTSWWLLAAVFLLTLVALYGLGMMFASLFLLFGREAWHTVNLLQEPVFLLTGMNFPIRIFPKAVAGVGLLIPLTAGMDAMRQVMFPSRADDFRFLSVETEVGILAALAVVFLFSAKRCLDYLERKAREEGRLGIRWQ